MWTFSNFKPHLLWITIKLAAPRSMAKISLNAQISSHFLWYQPNDLQLPWMYPWEDSATSLLFLRGVIPYREARSLHEAGKKKKSSTEKTITPNHKCQLLWRAAFTQDSHHRQLTVMAERCTCYGTQSCSTTGAVSKAGAQRPKLLQKGVSNVGLLGTYQISLSCVNQTINPVYRQLSLLNLTDLGSFLVWNTSAHIFACKANVQNKNLRK